MLISKVVDIEFDRDEILNEIFEQGEAEWFYNEIGTSMDDDDGEFKPPMVRSISDMPSLERDAFMKDLREQFTLLKLEWPI